MIEANNIYHGDCIETVKQIPDGSIDCILTDPPYLYLKNQKLERPFDETAFFGEAKRVLKKDGFIVMFGRGISFYRWNTMLANMGFDFKEEIVWDKRRVSSPMTQIGRTHETVSVFTKGKGILNFVKVNYEEVNGYKIDIIADTVKRLMFLFGNKRRAEEIANDIKKKNKGEYEYGNLRKSNRHQISLSSKIKESPVEISLINSMMNGMREKSIISEKCEAHIGSIHPTQKPVRLLERLLSLVTQPGDTILDPFCGSGSTAIACINSGRKYIGIEIDGEYYNASVERVNNHLTCRDLPAEAGKSRF